MNIIKVQEDFAIQFESKEEAENAVDVLRTLIQLYESKTSDYCDEKTMTIVPMQQGYAVLFVSKEAAQTVAAMFDIFMRVDIIEEFGDTFVRMAAEQEVKAFN